MKKFIILLLIGLAFTGQSCVDEYYVDEQSNYLGMTYETKPLNFIWYNDVGYMVRFDLPYKLYETDGMMVYILWEDADGLDIWRPLPQITTTNAGLTMYNYDYTVNDVSIYLTAEYPEDLQSSYVDNQIFRAVSLPSDWAKRTDINIENYNELIEKLEASGCKYQDVKFVNN